jgi:signal transduction histidine kinase
VVKIKRWAALLVLIAASLADRAAAMSTQDANLIVSISEATLREIPRAQKTASSLNDHEGQRHAAQALQLPVLERRSPRRLAQFELSATFNIPDAGAASLWAVYFVSLYDGGRVFINGVAIADVQTSTEGFTVRNVRPYHFPVPAHLVRNGENRIQVLWSSRESSIISKMLVGPADLVSENYQRRLFWQNTMAQVAFVYALVIALCMLGIYGLRRYQISYRRLGMSAIGCAIVVFVYILPEMPAPIFPYWRLVHIIGISMYSQGAWLFIIGEVQPENRWYPKLCAVVGLIGPVVYLVNFWLHDVSFMPDFERVWGMLTAAVGLYALYVLGGSLYRQPTWRKFIFLATTLIASGLALGDILLRSSGSSIFGSLGYSTQIAAPLWLSALATVLMTDFIASLRNQDSQHREMADHLAVQQSKMKALHETNQLRERESATLQERQRIMSDIHDGLGSQLVSSLALSERGHLDQVQTSLLLRECIDDLRLAIDTLSDGDNQFEVAAGNLRFRLEPRLRAAGIHLSWRVTHSADAGAIPSSANLALLRILQECITNALRHSGADQIGVNLDTTARLFTMTIADNGRGFSAPHSTIGRGINLMQKRARGMHAILTIQEGEGTQARLELSLLR